MDSLGLVVHDDQGFLMRVVNGGMEQGIFTRDRADEIIRISVAMANKYVLHKEVDFRSTDELAKVQETILKLIGVGLEIRSEGDVDQGMRYLMEGSPVNLFRLANTRVEKLRHRWSLLLEDHFVEVLVSPEEYQYLSGLTLQRLSEASIFSETETRTINDLTLQDELFSSLSTLEYYESELERYGFILRLRDILPFSLLNQSPSVQAANLADVDSLREALVNTLIISGCVQAPDPVAVSMNEVREFLATLDFDDVADVFPETLETAVIDLIQELGEELDESEGALLTKEIIHLSQKLMETIVSEADTIMSPSDNTFFKRWCRLAILTDSPDPMARILESDDMLDDFDFEVLMEQLLHSPEERFADLADKVPWDRMSADQIIRLMHGLPPSDQSAPAGKASLEGFNGPELIDLLEGINSQIVLKLMPALRKAVPRAEFTLEDLELLAGLPHDSSDALLRMANQPVDLEPDQILTEFSEASDRIRKIIFHSCQRSDCFPELFVEAWSSDPEFVKKRVKTLTPGEVGPFFYCAAGRVKPKIEESKKKDIKVRFASKGLNALFKALPKTKREAAVKYLKRQP